MYITRRDQDNINVYLLVSGPPKTTQLKPGRGKQYVMRGDGGNPSLRGDGFPPLPTLQIGPTIRLIAQSSFHPSYSDIATMVGTPNMYR